MDPIAHRLESMTPLQRAVFALKETQARLEAIERRQTEAIAIVGMACRFPGGVCDAESYWRLLCDEVDVIREMPPDRWDALAYYDPDPTAPGKMNSRWGGFLDGIDLFDNHFFGISDREAARIDPQHRLLLELAWEALEDAGLAPQGLRGSRTGVFVGISVSEYGVLLSGDRSQTDGYAATGTSLCLAANRLSFAFGWQGPSMAVDTACSSSLVAVHLACQNLRLGECDLALAGGASLLLSPTGTINLTKAGLSSPDGRVRAFDASASGYVRSEGAGIVVLKPLSAALRDSDPIHAVILGSAVNQNGASNGLTGPSRAGQEQVLREAYSRARVSPGRVHFVETQGTGTRLGDAIEAAALGSVLREGRRPGERCLIGSVKTNLGHLEAASGMASLIKATLALKHRHVPANLHFCTPSPEIPFGELPLKVPQTLEPWPESAEPRLAGVSAIGFGGSNSHVVLQEAPTPAAKQHSVDEPCRRILTLSARTDEALDELVHRYIAFLRQDSPAWSDVCHTAACRRDHHECRLAVLAESRQEAMDLLTRHVETVNRATGGNSHNGKDVSGRQSGSGSGNTPRVGSHPIYLGRKPYGRDLKVGFVYRGEGANWRSFLTRLVESMPGFSSCLDEIDGPLRRAAGWFLSDSCKDERRWSESAIARPALLAIQLVLTKWWRNLGVAPDAVLGQGVGEIAAACVAGILTIDEALSLVAESEGHEGTTRQEVMTRPAALPFLSAMDGQLHRGPDLDAAHWSRCLENASHWLDALERLRERQIDFVLEIGDEEDDLLATVGGLYAAGANIHWKNFFPGDGQCVRAPTYPWQRQRLWALKNAPQKGSPEDQTKASVIPSQATPVERLAAVEVATRPNLAAPYVAPRTRLEQEIAAAWSSVLRVEGIGIHDNFFELGGDSLHATILLNRLREQLGQSLPTQVLFQAQTIGELAEYLQSQDAAAILSPSNPRLSGAESAEELLSRLDDLTDDEVASLLSEAMANREGSHE